ncbi:MAG: hypothetical protein GY841_24190 [FCB group bacterium]|nr:hypothetical protein [FCB group bacterium]
MSQQDYQTKTIDGVEYAVYMMAPMESNDLLLDVSKMLGPSIGPLLDKFFGGGSLEAALEQQITPDFFAKAAAALFSGLDKAVVKRVIEEMREKTMANGKPLKPIFDIHFMGKLDQMYKWLAFAMQAQWGKCCSALVQGISAQGAKAIATTESQ